MKPKIENPTEVVKEQADDSALWFIEETIQETMLQEALRRLHAAIEGEFFIGKKCKYEE